MHGSFTLFLFVGTLHEHGKLFLIYYSFTCIVIAMLATLCFFYNDSGYCKIANFLDCYINPAFSVIHSLFS